MQNATSETIYKREYGEGSIRYKKKSGKWEVRVSNGLKGDGKRDRRLKSAKTEAEAKRILKQMIKERDASINRNAQTTTLEDYFDKFLKK